MATTPIILLAPAPVMSFVAMPSGASYVADRNALVVVSNGSVADELALIAAGCTTLEPNVGGTVTTQPGNAYTLQTSDENNAIIFTSASAVSVTLPDNLPVGFAVALYQGGAGSVSVSAAAGASVVTPNVSATPAQYCALDCIVLTNTTGTNAQWVAIAEPSQTGGGVIGASTLASLYSQDTAAHYAQYSIGQVFSDSTSANNGYWLKTGTSNGSGNWTQQSAITLAGLNAAITAETARAEAVEGSLYTSLNSYSPVLWADDAPFLSGEFDANGYPVFAIDAWGKPSGSLSEQYGKPAFLWFDDPLATIIQPGQIVTVDAAGNVCPPYDPLSTTAANLTAETARATSVETTLLDLTSVLTPFMWPDEPLFLGGAFDANGYPVFALDAGGQPVGAEAECLVRRSFIWADDALSPVILPGQVPAIALTPTAPSVTVDSSGNIVDNFGSVLDTYAPYIRSDGNVGLTNNAAKTTGSDIYVAATRGTVRGGPWTKGRILSWMDDATASGNAPLHERRWMDMTGASYLASIGGITKIVPVVDIGHSLTVGGVASLLTTTPPFARAVMYNGGPKIVQASGSGNDWSTPAPILDDAQIQLLAEYFEFQNVSGEGETHGGGVAWWFGQGSNLGASEAVMPASVGAGGATLANLLSATTQFSNLIRVLERSAAHAALNGLAWEPYITCDIGENDYATYPTNAATFQTNMIALQASIETAVKAIYSANGWSLPPYLSGHIPLFLQQGSSWTSSNYNSGGGYATNAVAYVFPALARAWPQQFIMVGPQYYTGNYASGTPGQSIHKTALGYKLDGQYNARAVSKLRAGAAPPGLYVTGVSNSGNTLTIATSATSNLAIDTSVVSDPGQSGLRVLDVTAGNANIALSGISVSGTAITATLASHTAGHAMLLGVGDMIASPPGNAGPTTGPRTTIRDSATDVSSGDTNSTSMVNYLCHDQFTWTAAA